MADCNETLREMYLFLDGELTPGVKGQIETHLEGCHDCLGAFEFHLVLRHTIAKVCREEQLPPGLADRIVACFGTEALPEGTEPR
jgi:mycothiol system anti-sigma-R factor